MLIGMVALDADGEAILAVGSRVAGISSDGPMS
jgi:hypothetical protein